MKERARRKEPGGKSEKELVRRNELGWRKKRGRSKKQGGGRSKNQGAGRSREEVEAGRRKELGGGRS